MAQYKEGTVSVTSGSATVTGSGTAFSANLTAGNLFTVAGDSVAYTVASAPSATTLTLTAPYSGSTGSGKSYGVTIDFTPDLGLPLMSVGDLNTAAIYNEAMKNIDNANAELGTAAFADIKGTVSQSGGVPTGAIIESGSNANGYYTKFADGTLICRKKSQSVASTITGSIAEFLETWPASFIDTNYAVSQMQATTHGDSKAATTQIGQGVSGRTVSSCYFIGSSRLELVVYYQFDLTAIGRWF